MARPVSLASCLEQWCSLTWTACMENGGELAPQRKFVVLLAEGESMLESQKKKKKKSPPWCFYLLFGHVYAKYYQKHILRLVLLILICDLAYSCFRLCVSLRQGSCHSYFYPWNYLCSTWMTLNCFHLLIMPPFMWYLLPS